MATPTDGWTNSPTPPGAVPGFSSQPVSGDVPGFSSQPTPAAAPGSYPKDWMGIVALIAPFVGLAIAGIVFGHLGMAANVRGEANNEGLTRAGLIVSYIFTGVGVLATILYVVLIVIVLRD